MLDKLRKLLNDPQQFWDELSKFECHQINAKNRKHALTQKELDDIITRLDNGTLLSSVQK